MLGKISIPYFVTLELDKRLRSEYWWTILEHVKEDMKGNPESTYVNVYSDRIKEWYNTTNDSFAIVAAYLNPYTCPENITRYWKIKGINNYV